MSKVHVFNAGPCILPQAAIDATIAALQDFKGTGVSVMCMSHRSPQWGEVMDECRALWKELLHIPDTHEVVFLGGGASLQFLYVAMNFLEHKAAYLDTGVWAHKALEQAQGLGEAYALACSKDKNYSYIPKGYTIPTDVDYFHITTNNTIYGTEIKEDYDSPVPLIADMSSDIMSRPVDVSKYALIYGGAQKNVGPAGVIFAIVRKDALGKVSRYIPTMLDYRTHIDKESMFNTPPVLPIFVMNETLKWLKGIGGVEAIQKVDQAKAELLYSEIDRNSLFTGTAAKEDRSCMNVCFVRGPRRRIHGLCQGQGYDGHQGSPLRGRLPCLHLQRLHPGRRPGSYRLHERI